MREYISQYKFTFGFWNEKIRGSTYGGWKTLNKLWTNRDSPQEFLNPEKGWL